MVVSDGYSIEEYAKQNMIVIVLPQTSKTCVCTVNPVQDRKESLSDTEQTLILNVVKSIYQGLYK